MKEIFINKDNLKKEEIDEEVIRVKALLIDDNNEMMLGYLNNIYQFPGGHLEFGETIYEALKREIKEETGIEINTEKLKPFMLLKYYTKNYLNSGKNRCNKIYYFEIKNNKEPNLENTNYTDEEKKGNYTLRKIKLDNLKNELIENVRLNSIGEVITKEMIMVIDEYLKNAS